MIGRLRARAAAYLRRRLGVPEIGTALDGVARRGFAPELVFDVGAYRGDFTRDCLRRWPKSRVACFEPLATQAMLLREFGATDPRVTVFETMLGASDGTLVDLHEGESATSALEEHVPTGFPVKSHRTRTLDAIVAEFFPRPPDLLKIDVQGYELEVLKGADRSLPHIKLLLAEINFLDIHRGVPLLSEVVEWLRGRGWVAYDICGLTRRPLDRALWQADLLFVPMSSDLRSDKRWQASVGTELLIPVVQ